MGVLLWFESDAPSGVLRSRLGSDVSKYDFDEGEIVSKGLEVWE